MSEVEKRVIFSNCISFQYDDATTGNVLSWNPNLDNTVNVVKPSGSQVFVGGSFTSVGTIPANSLRSRFVPVSASTGEEIRND